MEARGKVRGEDSRIIEVTISPESTQRWRHWHRGSKQWQFPGAEGTVTDATRTGWQGPPGWYRGAATCVGSSQTTGTTLLCRAWVLRSEGKAEDGMAADRPAAVNVGVTCDVVDLVSWCCGWSPGLCTPAAPSPAVRFLLAWPLRLTFTRVCPPELALPSAQFLAELSSPQTFLAGHQSLLRNRGPEKIHSGNDLGWGQNDLNLFGVLCLLCDAGQVA